MSDGPRIKPDPAVGGTPEQVESLGQVWTVQPLTPAVRQKFGAWCKLRALRELLPLKEEVPSATYRELLAVFEDSAGAGAYTWGGPLDDRKMGSGIIAALGDAEGRVKLTQLLLEKSHPGLSLERVVEIVAGNPDGFDQAMTAALGLGPNPEAPAATTPGTTSGTTTTRAV